MYTYQFALFSLFYISVQTIKKIENWLTTASFQDVLGVWLDNSYQWENNVSVEVFPYRAGRRTLKVG